MIGHSTKMPLPPAPENGNGYLPDELLLLPHSTLHACLVIQIISDAAQTIFLHARQLF